ncbi:MAG: peptide-methionine (S)-S-oxide reductase MsrA [Methanobacterium sp.]|uniref:peptide-methionine (S)-S-oxide reductase MsrA n=1 Tax=Methanobacterium sp. TaxID=2164 RepID=UPI003D661A1D|nr:peptide-methionine (S)-S-oxide reductase MsrA [Methanobacterium sp.]
MAGTNEYKKAVFGAGCFWGVEETFRTTKGVISTAVGYMGGHKENPTYEDVCSGKTGHAETVKIIYDPSVINYKELLDIFWKIHNPTTLNRQGPDIGEQYRSIVFYYDKEQENIARESKDRLQQSSLYSQDIVTEIVPASDFKFYMAEDYHQQYLKKSGHKSCKF